MEACLAVDAELGVTMCKNLFLCNRQKTNFYLLLMPDKVFKTKELSSQIQSARLSFGSPEDMEALLGVTPGSATVFGLMNDPEGRVQLLIDEDLLAQEFWGCHPCVNTSSLRIASRDVLERFLPAVGHASYRTVRLLGADAE
jgi:Ala-tRNA(Pro) deacylase